MEEQILAVQPDDSSELGIINSDQNIDLIIKQADKRVEVLKKVIAIALKRLSHLDIIDQQGKPYILSTACEKLMPVFGVSMKDLTYEKKIDNDDGGIYYIYIYKGTFYWGGGSIVAIGNCSSRDKFFAWDSNVKTFKPLSLIDEASVMKAAYSNLIMNGVTRLLGLKNMTWEQLQEYGFSKDKVQKINYASGGSGGGKISEAQAKRLYAIAKGSGRTDEDIKAYLKKNYKLEHTKDINRSDYENICAVMGSDGLLDTDTEEK